MCNAVVFSSVSSDLSTKFVVYVNAGRLGLCILKTAEERGRGGEYLIGNDYISVY